MVSMIFTTWDSRRSYIMILLSEPTDASRLPSTGQTSIQFIQATNTGIKISERDSIINSRQLISIIMYLINSISAANRVALNTCRSIL